MVCIVHINGRYSGSPESMFDYDIRNIASRGFNEYLKSIESAELSEAFWNVALIQELDTSSSASPISMYSLQHRLKIMRKGSFQRILLSVSLYLTWETYIIFFPKIILERME